MREEVKAGVVSADRMARGAGEVNEVQYEIGSSRAVERVTESNLHSASRF